MSFRAWLNEVAEPRRPDSKVSRRNIVKSGGTWRERKVIEFQFQTQQGNRVKVHFDRKEPEEYDVMFYVNDTQFDDASGGRDPEILSGVLWTIRTKADSLKANVLTFEAQTGDGDRKVIRNLDFSGYKDQALRLLSKFKQDISSHVVSMIEPNAAIYLKLNRPVPAARPDINKSIWFKFIENLMSLISTDGQIKNILDQFKTSIHLNNLDRHIDTRELLVVLQNLSNALESRTEAGWIRHQNRREIIWGKLVERYLSDIWNMEKIGTKFYLTRKDVVK